MSEASEPAPSGVIRRFAPEIVLAVLASAVFLSNLGVMELWGKREQRAVAEALDTLDGNNWLVAHIQSRPRLEKPPLPRWTIASLMAVTGLRTETIARLPSALSALAMVGLVYGLGRRIGGRSLGLAAGLMLTSTVFFVIESRQAGNDGPLGFFVALALYAAFRRLHGGPADESPGVPGDRLGSKHWTTVCWAAMGLGFLSKGPVVVLIACLAVIPYLITARRLKVGGRALLNVPGIVAFAVLALSWPVPVLWFDPTAADIWWLEMGQKAGGAGVRHHRQRWFLNEWPWMTFPWTVLTTWGLIAPFVGRGRLTHSPRLFAWWWAVANLAMFSLWSVAKPNYYVPCEAAVALMAASVWNDLLGLTRDTASRFAPRARRILYAHWIVIAAAAIVAPLLVLAAKQSAPFMRDRLTPELAAAFLIPSLCVSSIVLAAVALSVAAWRRRADSAVLAWLVGGIAGTLLVGYATIVPTFNPGQSHRVLSAQLESVLPRDLDTVMFFRELDEGLWFYLKGRKLAPVPGSTPAYSKAFGIHIEIRDGKLEYNEAKRIQAQRQVLVDWLDSDQHESPYVLIRAKAFDQFSPGIAERAEPVFREDGVGRNNLMLLKLRSKAEIATAAQAERN